MTEEVKQPDANAGLPEGVTPSLTQTQVQGAPAQPEIATKPEPTPEPETKEEETTKDAEDTTEDKQDTPDEIPEEYPDYGDPTANAVVDILREAEVPVKEAHDLFVEAFETGDFTKVDLTKLVEKLGKAKTDLVMLGVKTYYENSVSGVKDIVNAVYEEVGGKANFDKVAVWAKERAKTDAKFAKELEGFNQMFDLNRTAAVMAANALKGMYEADNQNGSLRRTQIHGDSAVTTSTSQSEHFTKGEYLNKVKEAYNKGDMAEFNRLRALRKSQLS